MTTDRRTRPAVTPEQQADHPRVRADGMCPLCGGSKDLGLVACWVCYRARRLKYGNPEAERQIDEAERRKITLELFWLRRRAEP